MTTRNKHANVGLPVDVGSQESVVQLTAVEPECELCGRGFKSARGLTLHKRLAHAITHHADGAAKLQTRKSKHWTSEERRSLARVELSVVQEGYGAIGLVRTMADKFKERTFELIKSQRQKADYKAILAELREEASQARDVAEQRDAEVGSARTAGSDTDDEWKEDLETWFGVMNHPSDFVRDFCRAVVSSDVELYHGTFARWITSLAEPRVRAKRPWKPAPVAGRSRKAKRQEAYRSLQALWSSRRSRACNSALDAS